MKDLFIPVGLGVVMLSLGLTLTIADFRRALQYPRAVGVALFCQIVLMPIAAFLLAKGFGLGPELAFGLMLLAATPGGATANLYSHLSGGDVALNITLTAINSVLSLITMPIILGLSLEYFLSTNRAIPLQAEKVIQALTIVVIPVAIGMLIRHLKPALARRMEKPASALAGLFLLAIATFVLYFQWQQLIDYFPQVGGAVVIFNVLSLVVGYAIALWINIERRQAIAIGMEVGVHNSGLATGLALSPMVFNSPTIAIAPALYGMLSLFIAAAFGALVVRGVKRQAA